MMYSLILNANTVHNSIYLKIIPFLCCDGMYRSGNGLVHVIFNLFHFLSKPRAVYGFWLSIR